MRTPLGKWIVPPSQQRQHHFAYACQDNLWIRQDVENTYSEFRQFAVDKGYLDMQRTVDIGDIPCEAMPVEVQNDVEASTWSYTQPPQWQHAFKRPQITPVNTFADFVESLQPWEQELLQHTEYTSEPFDFCSDLQPHLRAVSDASVRHETQGAFGWALRNEQSVNVASGMGPARGGGKVTSHRAEAYGLLALLRFLIKMAEFSEMQRQWIEIIATDSLSLLDTLRGKDEARLEGERDELINLSGSKVDLNCVSADWDVLIEIQDSLAQLLQIRLQHVKGHQDRQQSYQNLDQLG
jgi:ribonuclease HI